MNQEDGKALVKHLTKSIVPRTDRQKTIVDGIGRVLIENPMASFCFMGDTGTGKTFLMAQIQNARRWLFENTATELGHSYEVWNLAEYLERYNAAQINGDNLREDSPRRRSGRCSFAVSISPSKSPPV